MSDGVARYLNAYPVQARQGTMRYRARKFARRNRWAVLASAAAVLTWRASWCRLH